MGESWVENRLVLLSADRSALADFQGRAASAKPSAPVWASPAAVVDRLRGLLSNGLTRAESLIHGIAHEAAVRHLEAELPSPDRDEDWLKGVLSHLDKLDRQAVPPVGSFGGALSLAALSPLPSELLQLTWGLVGQPWYLDNWGVTQDVLAVQPHDLRSLDDGRYETEYTFMTLGGPIAPAIRHASWRHRAVTFALVCLDYEQDTVHCHVTQAGHAMDFSPQVTRFRDTIIKRSAADRSRDADAAEMASCSYDRQVLDKHVVAAVKAFQIKHKLTPQMPEPVRAVDDSPRVVAAPFRVA